MKSVENTIWEAATLVLLMGVFYEVHRLDGLRWHDICIGSGGMIKIPSFMTIGSGIRVTLRVLPQQF
jgi:hypothetical protein